MRNLLRRWFPGKPKAEVHSCESPETWQALMDQSREHLERAQRYLNNFVSCPGSRLSFIMVYTGSNGKNESCVFSVGNHEILLNTMLEAATFFTLAKVERDKAQEEKAEAAFERARRN